MTLNLLGPTESGEYKDNYLDNHQLYVEEIKKIQSEFSEFNLSDVETHELCVLLYFNWVITDMNETQDQLVDYLTRREDKVLKRFSRDVREHTE